ncbi:sensor histidine kinase [Acidimangrovimonas pyrenivorans]|uniref:histidine kinase n=1 Tax=Acidimangrovimonas pyrenivorans TaxID=2030798 RepID=A0ABV7AIH8_9RHOB
MSNLAQKMRDFVQSSLVLFWQRQAMFVGAAVLAGYFYNTQLAITCYLAALATELFDLVLAKSVIRWHEAGGAGNVEQEKYYLNLLTLSSVFSAMAVSLFTILVAREEGISNHFAPLFFLIAAGLFAAMNNHQLLRVLVARLIIYGLALIYIPAHDLWVTGAPLDSELWLQFGTLLLVLYFIVDCSRVYFKLYHRNLAQMTELRQERDRAEHAYEVQSQFVSIVSHELRTPLTSIKGALGLIQNGSLGEVSPQVGKLIGTAYKNSDRLAVLINDLLDLQKLEAAKMKFNITTLDLVSLVRDAVEANESYGKSLNVTFNAHLPRKPVWVRGDHDRLIQVMSNVLSNSAKFSADSDKVDVTLELHGGKARVSVRDYGEGIPPGSKDVVFGRFSQVDPSATRKIGGAGLGMSITRQILDALNGSIDYESEPGKGTTFFIDLDLADHAPSAEPAPSATASVPATAKAAVAKRAGSEVSAHGPARRSVA